MNKKTIIIVSIIIVNILLASGLTTLYFMYFNKEKPDEEVEGQVEAVAIQGNYAYLAHYNRGFEILSISDPHNPKKIASLSTPGNATEVSIHNNYAFVSLEENGFCIINITKPTQPEIIKVITNGRNVVETIVCSNTLFLATNSPSELQLFDISNSPNPLSIYNISISQEVTGLSVLQDIVYLSVKDGGITIVNTSLSSNPVIVPNWNDYNNHSYGVDTKYINGKRYVYLASGTNGLVILNTTNVSQIMRIGSYNNWGELVDVTVNGDFAYCCAADFGLVVLNISDPTNPIEMTIFDTAGNCIDIAIKDYIVVLADKWNGIEIYDFTNHFSPEFLAGVFASGWVLTITGNITYQLKSCIQQLKRYPSITQEYYLKGNPTFRANYTGVKVRYLITVIANITSTVNIRVKAIDQYSVLLNLENDLSIESDIIIAYQKNGQDIKSYSEGGEGPLRLIIPQRYEGEYNGQFCVKFVNEIEILNSIS
ncbi:MAG: molybdopterin-dependent oxidoreductase [Asgard group archaeon]|nr:molybdopterin-dependent oxidoreductase [Asgard group archaeon]